VIVCVDVDYRPTEVAAACVGFHDWPDPAAARTSVTRTPGAPPPYESGAFYRRELPYLLAALGEFTALGTPPRLIIVDGYVWLAPDHPGLGVHVHTALGVPVIGMAKRPFATAAAQPVLRGQSQVPLHVTAIGIDVHAAASAIAAMHGPHRLPTLLKLVDRLARDA
jgi:deoxyribonuclease V